ncbi:MAG TPA: 2-succinyl-5-enolpyruvyl-6-hydroxy-3-cyclohexene-1-carboxylic-acid synthase, partial [Dehalococcoidia bacterium]
GSRSTPLALLFRRHPAVRVWTHLDERSAGFFALGMAKARREPVAVVVTSGTAAANLTPAVVEAYHGGVPLLVLTADRPPEARDVGALQTIDQVRLYGSHAKWFQEMLLPEEGPEAVRHARVAAARAAATARADRPGPVHLNFPFREPLIPAPGLPTGPVPEDAADRPAVAVSRAPRRAGPDVVDRLARDVQPLRRGLVVCGPLDRPGFPEAAARLAGRLGWPLLADALSQARCGPHVGPAVVTAYDAFLRDPALAERLAPEAVLRFGAAPVSKPLLQYLQRHAGARQVVVDGGEGWTDPALTATDVVHADPHSFCEDLLAALPGDAPADGAWSERWARLDAGARRALAAGLRSEEGLTEPRAFLELADLLPDGATVFAGNSMPVRDLDTFFPPRERPVRFLANRGASGIDGVVSSALGAAAASPGPLLLVLGDLSFYHDMNGLLAAKLHGLRATIVVLNNDGGGIFSFLPQAEHGEHFEELFGTPHGLSFAPVAELYGVGYRRVASWEEFRAAVADGLGSDGVQVVEVPTDRAANVALHRRLFAAVSEAAAAVEGAAPSRGGTAP